MSRLQRRIVTESRRALEPLGYYEPEVTYDIEHVAGGLDRDDSRHAGPPDTSVRSDIDARGPGESERAIRDVIEARMLKPGLRLNHGTYERMKGELIRAAKNDGYLDAQLTQQDLVIDRAERRANVAIELETGERYRYGEILSYRT